jgi:hypothetical protein
VCRDPCFRVFTGILSGIILPGNNRETGNILTVYRNSSGNRIFRFSISTVLPFSEYKEKEGEENFFIHEPLVFRSSQGIVNR